MYWDEWKIRQILVRKLDNILIVYQSIATNQKCMHILEDVNKVRFVHCYFIAFQKCQLRYIYIFLDTYEKKFFSE